MSNLSKVISASILLLFVGCASLTRESLPELSCSGPITESSTLEELVSRYGVENLRGEEIEMGEGETAEGTAIYPDDPSRRIEVVWTDAGRRNRVASVRVAEPSEWSVEGLTTGIDLRTIERMNGRPFSLYGFDWDYSGTTASWNGGKLDSTGDCRVLARFRPSGDADSGQSLSGEEIFGSEDARMRELNPIVYELLLIFE